MLVATRSGSYGLASELSIGSLLVSD